MNEIRNYNPDCDYCENCYKHGHEADDCDMPTREESMSSRSNDAMKLTAKGLAVILGIIILIGVLALIIAGALVATCC